VDKAPVKDPLQERAGLAAQIAANRWYHTIELAPGTLTPGHFDTRAVARIVPLPPDLSGKRCLDVGTYDGFWAFEMERRGAQSVTAIDVLDPDRWDWPAGSTPEARSAIGDPKRRSAGFELARSMLGSRVERVDLSVYELDPAEHGQFDVIYLGSLLLHLRDPVRALERVRNVCSGELLVVDAYDRRLTRLERRRPAATLDGAGRPWWWKPNLAGLARIVQAGGFEVVEGPRPFFMPFGSGFAKPRVTPRRLLTPVGRELATLAWRGDPHAALRARPRAH
jgi:tRNA (mo5U34)-methyltransferase